MNENVKAWIVIVLGTLFCLLLLFEKPYRQYKLSLMLSHPIRHSDVAGGGDPSISLEKNNNKK